MNRNNDNQLRLSDLQFEIVEDALVGHISSIEIKLEELKDFDLDIIHLRAKEYLENQKKRALEIHKSVSKYTILWK